VIHLLMLGFNNTITIERTLSKYRETSLASRYHKLWILNQHYPLPSKEIFNRDLNNLAIKYNATLLDAGSNLGLSAGFNYLLDRICWSPDDTIIGFDPDTNPCTMNWIDALDKALDEPGVAWASLGNEFSEMEMIERGYVQTVIQGMKAKVTLQPVLNSICAWKAGWLSRVGGLSEPRKWYGGLECSMWQKLNGLKWIFLDEYREHRNDMRQVGHDKEYFEWKMCYVEFKTTTDDFETWLSKR
jgi:hypothetical protein